MAERAHIHLATPDDLPFVLSLAKRETDSIGFLPGDLWIRPLSKTPNQVQAREAVLS